MPRQARKKNKSNIYHIMLRGINRQIIFEVSADYTKFIETLDRYKAISGYKVFAYCLMSNHIHMLIKADKEEPDLIMKRISCSYVYWYNSKYYRSGHLFQDRFRSEPVETDEYFLTVLRYIHQNPIKAKLVDNIGDYEFSSYNEYINGGSVVDRVLVLLGMRTDEFIKFNNEQNDDVCLDIEEQKFRLSDNDAKEVIKKLSGCNNMSELQLLEIAQRDEYIKELRKHGLSIRQISRLTGISKGVIEKIGR
ncbi:MAG: transposase [Clostridia bacterium]|nr:transposase [Clostridia bacterium]